VFSIGVDRNSGVDVGSGVEGAFDLVDDGEDVEGRGFQNTDTSCRSTSSGQLLAMLLFGVMIISKHSVAMSPVGFEVDWLC